MKTRSRGHDQFLDQLEDLRLRHGSPAYAAIAELTSQLKKLFPDDNEYHHLPVLSRQAISAVLRGERGDLPDGAWVAAYVLALLVFGWRVGVQPRPDHDTVAKILAYWQEQRYRACIDAGEAAADHEAEYATPGSATLAALESAQDTPTAPDLAQPNASGTLQAEYTTTELMDATDEKVEPGNQGPYLSQDQRAHIAGYGAGGQILLDGHAADDPNAMYQIAVLLALTTDRAGVDIDMAQLLNAYAAARDHPGAAQLNDHIRSGATLATHAELIATAASDPAITMLFRECIHAYHNPPPASPRKRSPDSR